MAILSGSNTYTGSTAIYAGTLEFANGGNETTRATISGSGAVGAGRRRSLDPHGQQRLHGRHDGHAGTLQLSGNNSIGDLAANGGTVIIAAGTTNVAETRDRDTRSWAPAVAWQVAGGVLNISGLNSWFSVGATSGTSTFTMTGGTFDCTSTWGLTIGHDVGTPESCPSMAAT